MLHPAQRPCDNRVRAPIRNFPQGCALVQGAPNLPTGRVSRPQYLSDLPLRPAPIGRECAGPEHIEIAWTL
jgi:hypothetical protein